MWVCTFRVPLGVGDSAAHLRSTLKQLLLAGGVDCREASDVGGTLIACTDGPTYVTKDSSQWVELYILYCMCIVTYVCMWYIALRMQFIILYCTVCESYCTTQLSHLCSTVCVSNYIVLYVCHIVLYSMCVILYCTVCVSYCIVQYVCHIVLYCMRVHCIALYVHCIGLYVHCIGLYVHCIAMYVHVIALYVCVDHALSCTHSAVKGLREMQSESFAHTLHILHRLLL